MLLTVTICLIATCCIDVSSGFLILSCPIQACDCSDSRVNCASRGLTEIPTYNNINTLFSFHPTKVIQMHFDGNNIYYLSANSFSTWKIGRGNVWVYLTQNHIAAIDDDAFEGLQTSITTLSLGHNNLQHIPDAIATLVNLQFLDLDHNPIAHFTAAGMRSIGQSLVSLTFSYDAFASWPDQLTYLDRLLSLSATSDVNASVIVPPIGGFNGLDNLATIKITLTTFPLSICSLVNIYSLDIFFLNDKVTMPDCASELQQLKSLTLMHGMPQFPDLRAFKLLTSITVTGNPSLFHIPEEFVTDNCSVGVLNLSDNGFRTVPDAIQKCASLRFLDLSANRIVIFEHNSIENLPLLETLDLSSNPLQYFSSLAFDHLPALENINVANTSLTSISPLAKIVTLTRIVAPESLVCTCAELDWLKNPVHRNITIQGSSYCSNRRNETIQQYITRSLPFC